jgi:hypothetical protein
MFAFPFPYQGCFLQLQPPSHIFPFATPQHQKNHKAPLPYHPTEIWYIIFSKEPLQTNPKKIPTEMENISKNNSAARKVCM